MLVDLQVYQEVFEIKFLNETEATYRAEALRMMRDPGFTVSGLVQVDCIHALCHSLTCVYYDSHTHTHTSSCLTT